MALCAPFSLWCQYHRLRPRDLSKPPDHNLIAEQSKIENWRFLWSIFAESTLVEMSPKQNG